jgi:hypothetical protein
LFSATASFSYYTASDRRISGEYKIVAYLEGRSCGEKEMICQKSDAGTEKDHGNLPAKINGAPADIRTKQLRTLVKGATLIHVYSSLKLRRKIKLHFHL